MCIHRTQPITMLASLAWCIVVAAVAAALLTLYPAIIIVDALGLDYTTYGPAFVNPEGVYRVYPHLRNVTRPVRPTINFATSLPLVGPLSWYASMHMNAMKTWCDLTNARGGLNISGIQHDVTFTWSTDDSSTVLSRLIYEDYLRNTTSANNQYFLLGTLNDIAHPIVRPLIEEQQQVVFNFWGNDHEVYRPGYNFSFGGWNLGDELFKPAIRLWWQRAQTFHAPGTTVNVCILNHPSPHSQFTCDGGRQVLAEINATSSRTMRVLVDGIFPLAATTADAANAYALCGANVDLLVVCTDYFEPAMLAGLRRSQLRPKAALSGAPIATYVL